MLIFPSISLTLACKLTLLVPRWCLVAQTLFFVTLAISLHACVEFSTSTKWRTAGQSSLARSSSRRWEALIVARRSMTTSSTWAICRRVAEVTFFRKRSARAPAPRARSSVYSCRALQRTFLSVSLTTLKSSERNVPCHAVVTREEMRRQVIHGPR